MLRLHEAFLCLPFFVVMRSKRILVVYTIPEPKREDPPLFSRPLCGFVKGFRVLFECPYLALLVRSS